MRLIVILAVSTKAPNPLQAITALHSRAIDLPSWIDPAYLRYTLIIHPQDSPLSEEEYVRVPHFCILALTINSELVLFSMQ